MAGYIFTVEIFYYIFIQAVPKSSALISEYKVYTTNVICSDIFHVFYPHIFVDTFKVNKSLNYRLERIHRYTCK